MRLFIPPIGAVITLEKDWTFILHQESRNVGLANALNLGKIKHYTGRGWDNKPYEFDSREWKDTEVTLPARTHLKISRIYIRNGVQDYNSVTFWADNKELFGKKKPRFWVKLPEANNIHFKDTDITIHMLTKRKILNG